MKKLLLNFCLLTIAFGCGNKEVFSPNKSNKEIAIASPLQTSTTLCSLKTHVRPPVDVLVLFDNSPSSNAFNQTTRSRLTSMIQGFVQDNFNYHIVVAPLVSSSASDISTAVIFANSNSAKVDFKTKNKLNIIKNNFIFSLFNFLTF